MDGIDPIFSTADGVMAVDREHTIVLWNEGAEALLGFRAKEVLGRFCYEVINSRDDSGRPACRRGCPTMLMVLRQELVGSCNRLVRRKEGGEVWLSFSTLLIPSRWRDLFVLVHLFRDVSQHKQLETFAEQLSSNLAKLCLVRGPNPPTAAHPPRIPPDLSAREAEVLRLLASGASTDAIAEKLFISPATAKNHIQHTLTKLGVHTRLEAVVLALRNGQL